MKFDYLARTKKGEMQSGVIESPNQPTALEALQKRDLIVIRLRPAGAAPIFARRIKIFERVKRKEVFVFFRELSILVGADVPLVQSLRALSEQSENPRLKEILFEIASDVDGGMSFSKALAEHPKIFSSFCINLIKAGEVAGRLQDCLVYLADYLEKEYYLISRIRGAMAYPAFILGAFLIVGVLVMVMVIPQLTSILVEAGQELPLSTKIVITTSNFLRGWGWLLLLFAIIGSIVGWRYRRTRIGRANWDKLILKLPVFGKILQKTYLARLADNLSALVKGGVSIIQSLNISGQVINNYVFQQVLWQARDEVRGGKTVSSILQRYEEFPPLFVQMVKTGEQTGKLDAILEKLSVFYNREVENIVANLSQLIEPMLIVVLGIGVAILIFAVFMPIYNLAGGI